MGPLSPLQPRFGHLGLAVFMPLPKFVQGNVKSLMVSCFRYIKLAPAPASSINLWGESLPTMGNLPSSWVLAMGLNVQPGHPESPQSTYSSPFIYLFEG